MRLNWNKLHFKDENDFYEILGFICNNSNRQYLRLYKEENPKAGARGIEMLLSYRYCDKKYFPTTLKNAFELSKEKRISETDYLRELENNFGFTKYVDCTGKKFSYNLHYHNIDDVIEKIPPEFLESFYKGYETCMGIDIKNDKVKENTYNDSFESERQEEGKKKVYYTTRYERSKKNRDDAIKEHGTKCYICEFDFGETYGKLGEGFIEVHHKVPLSTLKKKVKIDPKEDLVCICANCHRMIHRFKNDIVTIEELKKIVEDNKTNKG